MVAEALISYGLEAEVGNAAEIADLDGYDAVIVGGALYNNRWHTDATDFLHRYAHLLQHLPLWFFSSGPLDPSASERDIPPVPGVRRAMTRLDARGHVTFGGCLQEGAKGRIAKMIVRSGKGGDFRNFPEIEAWTARVAGELVAERANN